VLHLYSATRARPLAARLAEVLGATPPDPFVPEWMAVPSDGMRRWLALELAGYLGASDRGGDGVAANIVRAYPGTLRTCVLASDRGDDDPDPWAIEQLVWSVLAASERAVDDPALLALAGLPPGASRYARARRVADLFDRYHLHRPAMVRAWAVGDDVDGTGGPLSGHHAWQSHLWRLVRAEVGEPSPPERWPDLIGRLAHSELALDLPPRLVLFGFTLLPGGGFLPLLEATAAHRDVHLFLLEPSRLEAVDLSRLSPRRTAAGLGLRAEDVTAATAVQPLLQSWGGLHRETALLLADAEAGGLPAREWVDPAEEADPSTLLHRLQRDIRANRVSSGVHPFDPSDRSVQFHACFGATRQVEVLRDAILHLLEDDGSDLTEDDIVVLCPSLERFAPLIQAAFGPSAEAAEAAEPAISTAAKPPEWDDRRGAPRLRYRIADQSIGSTNPLLSATAALLDLVTGRLESTSVLDFCALAPVRARFRFDDEDLDDIAGWVTETNVRWGLDPEHRVSFGVPASIRTNTWQASLDMLLVGATVDEDDGLSLAIGEVAPYGVEGSATDTLGRLAQALWYLRGLVTEARTAKPIGEWIGILRTACGGLFATDSRGRWQVETLGRIFEEVVRSASAEGAPATTPLEFVDIRRLFGERLEAMPGRPDYFRGGITVSSLIPLRWIPFRVVCLLGMDQSAFGPPPAAGDDLVAAVPELGDPDPRAEMRQSLLEALLAAGEHLVVLRDGHDVRTNQVVPRSVVVADLFDAVVSQVESGGQAALADQLEIDHPRQPFDERNFAASALVPGMVWGFDRGSLAGAEAGRQRNRQRRSFVSTPLMDPETSVIDIDELRAFFRNPSAYFLSHRLEARLPRAEEEPSSLLPVDLMGLPRWQVATRLLTARLERVDTAIWRTVEHQRGTLPPGSLGDRAVQALVDDVDALVAAVSDLGVDNRPPEPFEVDVALTDGTRIVGTVPLRLPEPARGPLRASYSKLKAAHRVEAWLDLMALVATDPQGQWRAVAMGQPTRSGLSPERFDIGIAGAPPTWRSKAQAALGVAVDCYRRGLTEPVPLFAGFSYEVHCGRAKPNAWSNDHSFPDGVDPAVVLAFGGIGFDEVVSLSGRPGDPGDGGDRVSRFASYLYGAIDASTLPWESMADTGSPAVGKAPPS
jgi:exodeoxyribonuclease V gamma subunit